MDKSDGGDCYAVTCSERVANTHSLYAIDAIRPPYHHADVCRFSKCPDWCAGRAYAWATRTSHQSRPDATILPDESPAEAVSLPSHGASGSPPSSGIRAARRLSQSGPAIVLGTLDNIPIARRLPGGSPDDRGFSVNPLDSGRAVRSGGRRRSACSASTTTATPPTRRRSCCGRRGSRRWPMLRRSVSPAAADVFRPASACSTCKCRGWTATSWPGCCAAAGGGPVLLVAVTAMSDEESRGRTSGRRFPPAPGQARGPRASPRAGGRPLACVGVGGGNNPPGPPVLSELRNPRDGWCRGDAA